MSSKRIRKEKKCINCQESEKVMYRCRKSIEHQWSFYCKICMEKIRSESGEYQYGGTWKREK